ncbi:MAG: phage holin family protein [Patescibacteria group bacterium]|nr:phage holin family protein [Patescibacteria group bacterium]
MKKIFRMIIFSATAIYLTSLWNKGFVINFDFFSFLKASLFIALAYYLIIPTSKIIFLPLNFLTLGLFSVIFYALILYFFSNNFGLITIKSWYFSGEKFLNFIITPMNINYLVNIFLSAFSISTIINLLEKIL